VGGFKQNHIEIEVIDMRQTAFQNQIKATSINSITPAQILQAGSPIFLGIADKADLHAINTVIDAYQGIHAPIYGNPIPLTGSVVSVDGSETLLAPSNNEVRRVLAISCENTGGGAPIVFDITLGGMIISSGNIVAPATVASIQLSNDLYASKNLPLAVAVTSGSAGELTSSVASILTVQ
jgi:hypothetical protein